jgi:hypothetical protein
VDGEARWSKDEEIFGRLVQRVDAAWNQLAIEGRLLCEVWEEVRL